MGISTEVISWKFASERALVRGNAATRSIVFRLILMALFARKSRCVVKVVRCNSAGG